MGCASNSPIFFWYSFKSETLYDSFSHIGYPTIKKITGKMKTYFLNASILNRRHKFKIIAWNRCSTYATDREMIFIIIN